MLDDKECPTLGAENAEVLLQEGERKLIESENMRNTLEDRKRKLEELIRTRDEELRKIHTPALLLIGDHEVIYNSQRVIQRATRLVAGLKAGIVPNANHNAEYTAPDFVNTKILDFLAG